VDRLFTPSAPLEARRVRVSRRHRIEDTAAADSRAGTQDDAVTARGDHRSVEAQLREAAHAGYACERPGSSVMHECARRDRSQRLQLDVEAIARRVRPRLDEDVAAAKVPAFDARQRERYALTRESDIDFAIVHLHASHSDVPTGRLRAHRVAGGDAAGPERAGRDRADPAQREDPVDVQAHRPLVALRLDGCAPERGAQLVEPRARLRAHGDDLRFGDELACLAQRELELLVVDGVGLRDRDDPALDAEQPENRQVLVRLWARAFTCIDDEQEEVDSRCPGDHGSDEPLVSGHVDERQSPAVRELERRVAEIDRDPALLFLGQPVRVLAGERPHEPRLAVVDVAGRSDGQRHVA
jgi:hypothetical protein